MILSSLILGLLLLRFSHGDIFSIFLLCLRPLLFVVLATLTTALLVLGLGVLVPAGLYLSETFHSMYLLLAIVIILNIIILIIKIVYIQGRINLFT
jgi:hypothetical protein